jgi:hypothetical protein
MNGIKCYYCGKFIAFKDFEGGNVQYVPEFYCGASLYPPENVPICPNCVEKETNVEEIPTTHNEPTTNKGL